jgi:hypothetical protein
MLFECHPVHDVERLEYSKDRIDQRIGHSQYYPAAGSKKIVAFSGESAHCAEWNMLQYGESCNDIKRTLGCYRCGKLAAN